MRRPRIPLACAAAALFCLACGDAPRPADPIAPARRASSSADSALPPGHPPLEGLPAGHPPVAGAGAAPSAELTDPSQFAGRVVLKGELARADRGRLFVTLRQKGQKMPLWAYVVDLVDPEVERKGLQPAQGDTRELIFVLNKDTTILRSQLPRGAALEIEVCYDLDGSVDTKQDAVAAVVDARAGDLGLYVELEPSGQD